MAYKRCFEQKAVVKGRSVTATRRGITSQEFTLVFKVCAAWVKLSTSGSSDLPPLELY